MSADRKSPDAPNSTTPDAASTPDVQAFKQNILAKLKYAVGKDPANAYIHDLSLIHI